MNAADQYTDLTAEIADIEAQEKALQDRKQAALTRREQPTVLDENGDELSPGPVPEPAWPHRTMEYLGETWEVRTPATEALQAFAMATSKYTPAAVQNDVITGFFARHLSPASYARFLERCGDPDDTDFKGKAVSEFMRGISTQGTSRPTTPSRA
jgi:hypothetical protein